MTTIRRLGWTSIALLALTGCDATPTTPAPAPVSATPATTPTNAAPAQNDIKAMPVEPAKGEEPKKEAAAPAEKLSDEQMAEIKKLPADEQPIALAQMTCPVSGDKLGEMGAPIKQVVGGKTFFLCCAGCEKTVKAKPDEVLAKLKK